jgi:hypothetical protein
LSNKSRSNGHQAPAVARTLAGGAHNVDPVQQLDGAGTEACAALASTGTRSCSSTSTARGHRRAAGHHQAPTAAGTLGCSAQDTDSVPQLDRRGRRGRRGAGGQGRHPGLPVRRHVPKSRRRECLKSAASPPKLRAFRPPLTRAGSKTGGHHSVGTRRQC